MPCPTCSSTGRPAAAHSRRCKLLTWLTTPHAEQRRKAYELPHGQSQRLSPGLEDLLILKQSVHWTSTTPSSIPACWHAIRPAVSYSMRPPSRLTGARGPA